MGSFLNSVFFFLLLSKLQIFLITTAINAEFGLYSEKWYECLSCSWLVISLLNRTTSISNWEEREHVYEQKEDLKPFSVMITVITSPVLVSPLYGARVELLSIRVVFLFYKSLLLC